MRFFKDVVIHFELKGVMDLNFYFIFFNFFVPGRDTAQTVKERFGKKLYESLLV